MRAPHHALSLLIALLVGAPACFDSSMTANLPCTSARQCGLGQVCAEGFCDGPPADFDPTAYCGDGILEGGELCWAEREFRPSGAQPRSVVATDVDGDGKPDVVVANENAGSVTVFRIGADGSLDEGETVPVGGRPVSVAVGDLVGTGVAAIAVATSTGLAVMRVGPAGYTPEQVDLPTLANPVGVAVGDFDSDGVDDVAVASGTDRGVAVVRLDRKTDAWIASEVVNTIGEPRPDALVVGTVSEAAAPLGLFVGTSHGVEVVQGAGDGQLGDGSARELSGSAWGLAVGTINGQAGFDVVAACEEGDTAQLCVLPGLPQNGSLELALRQELGSNPASVALGDLDDDGTLDVVVVDPASDKIWALTSVATGTFEPELRTPRPIPAGKTPQDIALGDFDGDGRLDLVTADRGGGGVSIHLSAE